MSHVKNRAKFQTMAILQEHALRRGGNYTLANGERSDYYIDCRQVTFSPYLYRLCESILSYFDRDGVDLIAGPALGACPLVSGLQMLLRTKRTAMVRPDAKNHGVGGRVV